MEKRVQMSHQTGALSMASEFQTIELMDIFNDPIPAHSMNMQVPIFQAERRVKK